MISSASAIGPVVRPMLAVCALAGAATAQIPESPFVVRLETVATGLTAPVQAKSPGDNRLFIVDQSGRIRILRNGALLPTPFLDVSALLAPLNAGYDERGLLGLAFHPNFATNGRFFIHYTAPRTGVPGDPCFGTSRGCSSEVIAEYRVSAANPDIADPASGVELLRVAKPQFNHAGGGIDFGPDGMLYVGLGDGGGANDGLSDNPPSHGPMGNAQNLSTPLGKILRFDVSTPGVLGMPADNPFVDIPEAYPGVYAYGFRNPYAFSFDAGLGGNGRLIVADVGQNLFEEIDIVTAGGNYGWPLKEGFHCFDPFNPNSAPASCPGADETLTPQAEYPHTMGDTPIGVAVVGGYVYRGNRMPALRGQYIFGDFSTGFGVPDGSLFIYEAIRHAPEVQRLNLEGGGPLGLYVKGFGHDSRGEVYLLASTILGPTGTSGVVLRIATCPADLTADGFLDFFDYDVYVGAFEAGDPAADLNGDDFIDFFDYADFVSAFETGC